MQSFTVDSAQLAQFPRKLISWYQKSGRDLPWRNTHDPYRILISEVMLQQTQVITVIERYERWLKRFPTVQSLAAAPTAAVLQEWAGLGYNRRALALHQIAQRVLRDYAGQFPTDIAELQTFKGIGEYTAHAIASFAFKQRAPLVDTNIKRVLGRIFFGFKKLEQLRDEHGLFWTLSRMIIERAKSPYDFNQGMMDFGATICIAKRPKCAVCPMQTICKSYPSILKANPEQLRVKTKRTEPLYFGQPRRIWRGKILQYLQTHQVATLTQIGKAIQPDWKAERLPWLTAVIATMAKDGLVSYRQSKVTLPQ